VVDAESRGWGFPRPQPGQVPQRAAFLRLAPHKPIPFPRLPGAAPQRTGPGATAPLSGQSNSTKAAATATPSTAYQQHRQEEDQVLDCVKILSVEGLAASHSCGYEHSDMHKPPYTKEIDERVRPSTDTIAANMDNTLSTRNGHPTSTDLSDLVIVPRRCRAPQVYSLLIVREPYERRVPGGRRDLCSALHGLLSLIIRCPYATDRGGQLLLDYPLSSRIRMM